MRILHIIATVSPAAGGPSEAVRMLVAFAPAGVQSEIVSVDAPGAAFLADYGCPVHALGPARTSYQYSAGLLPWLRANRSRFDGVIVHGLWTYSNFAALRALRGQTPYVVFVHGMLDPYFKRASAAKHLKKLPFWWLVERPLLRAAMRVLFTSAVEDTLARESFDEAPWRALIVPLGTDTPPPVAEVDFEEFHARCPAVKGKRFLLYLGRLHPKKGGDLLVEALGGCADHDLHLVMAGPDALPFQAQLAAMAVRCGVSDRVHFPGMLTGPAKVGAFASCEAFILPSHQENFGIAVVEALAAGRPVLLSDKINIAPEIAADGAGMVEADTLEGTSKLLERWLTLTPAGQQTMGECALRTFATRYDMRHNTEAILDVFHP